MRGTGSVVAAVEVAGGTSATIVGKPERFIFEMPDRLFAIATALPSSVTASTPTSSGEFTPISGPCSS